MHIPARALASLGAAALLASTGALAATVNVTLTGSQEAPPNSSTATGSGTFTLNPGDTISFDILFSGLDEGSRVPLGLTVAHIHGSTAPGIGLPGTNAPVLLDIVGGTPPAGVSGPLPGATGGNLVGIDVPVDSTFLLALSLGQAYFNVHSVSFPGGEIRGQIPALSNTSVIPVPAALPLMFGGLLLIGAGALRRRAPLSAAAAGSALT